MSHGQLVVHSASVESAIAAARRAIRETGSTAQVLRDLSLQWTTVFSWNASAEGFFAVVAQELAYYITGHRLVHGKPLAGHGLGPRRRPSCGTSRTIADRRHVLWVLEMICRIIQWSDVREDLQSRQLCSSARSREVSDGASRSRLSERGMLKVTLQYHDFTISCSAVSRNSCVYCIG